MLGGRWPLVRGAGGDARRGRPGDPGAVRRRPPSTTAAGTTPSTRPGCTPRPRANWPVYVSAFGPRAARLAADLGDGLVTTAPDPELLRAYRESGGTGPTLAGTKACWAPDEQRAVATRHRLWASEHLPGELNQLLPTRGTSSRRSSWCRSRRPPGGGNGPDPQAHLALLRPYVEAGFDEVYVGQIGGHVEEFFACYRDRVLPELAG
ncbi:hypothetical protein KCH_06900 [Kitasatospora cheerisanensis KCTC 2395]|uniref:Luciferase-like domain-containing protein n=1 Tax=Kitasatospora cheerisanensis KCTC 2395 TaxID=1348663 RepID=A0A066ZBP5_9ACTN|nr:hypothetical protein KCH_06900 [Kitasatospora cheerisanensis KCTC 2395]